MPEVGIKAKESGFSHWRRELMKGGRKTSGTKRLSEACLYLIMTLPQFKERDTELRNDVRRWVRCAMSTAKKQHNDIFDFKSLHCCHGFIISYENSKSKHFFSTRRYKPLFFLNHCSSLTWKKMEIVMKSVSVRVCVCVLRRPEMV